MKQQAFQCGELRDEHDQIIRAGATARKHHLLILTITLSWTIS